MKPLWITFIDDAYGPLYRRHFLPSFWQHNEKDFHLQLEQENGEFGNFGNTDFNESYKKQMRELHYYVANNIGRQIVWSDADIRFYGPVLPDLLRLQKEFYPLDIFAAMDGATYCTGFLFFRASYKILRFIEDWIDLNNSRVWGHAQESFNATIVDARHHPDGARFFSLGEQYWNVGHARLPTLWDKSLPVPEPPANILLHHANYTKGIENKIALLDGVQQIVTARVATKEK